MTSFLKNLKSTLLDSNGNKNKMPSRHHPNEDPFKRINSWDDGFEYVNGGDRSVPSGNPGPMYSPPPPKPTRRSTYEPNHRRERHSQPSPPDSDDGAPRRYRRGPTRRSPSPPYSDDDTPRRYRREPTRRSPSPPRRRESRREPERYRDHDEAPRSRRPNPDSHYTAPPPRARSSPRAYSRTPSPPRARRNERDFRDAHHYDTRSPSPPRTRPSTRDHHDRDPPHQHSRPRSSGSGNSNDKKYPPRAGDKRPPISRLKTTSAADAAKKGVAGLSPRWQKAAQAALAAGSAAAFQMRSQPGAWKGEKGAKVATAALGAAAMDMFLKNSGGDDSRDRERERDRDRDYERDRDYGRERERGGGNRKHSGVEVLGDFVGDFLVDQFSKRTSGRR